MRSGGNSPARAAGRVIRAEDRGGCLGAETNERRPSGLMRRISGSIPEAISRSDLDEWPFVRAQGWNPAKAVGVVTPLAALAIGGPVFRHDPTQTPGPPFVYTG